MTHDLQATDPTAHAHDAHCWWDHTKPGWVCPPATDRVDVRDMLVVHTAMLREFRLLRGAVASVAGGERRRARTIDSHLGLLCDLLHHHHEGEDELLWPVLRPRLAAKHQRLLDVAEAQHAGLERALGDVAVARGAWVEEASTGSRDALVRALEVLSTLLTEHLDGEERTLLPLAAAYLTEDEWHAIGEAGVANIAKPTLPLVLGMFAYEGDPEVLASMLALAPLVPRLLLPRIAPGVYARRARAVYGTRTP